MEMTRRALGASIATGVFALITAAPLQAQVQRSYESNTDFYARRSLEQSQMQNMIADNMANLRMSQPIEQSCRAAYAKVGAARIVARNATTRFSSSPDFSITESMREMFRQRILASESIQQTQDTDLQFATEHSGCGALAAQGGAECTGYAVRSGQICNLPPDSRWFQALALRA